MFFLSDEMPFSFDEMLLFGAASGGKLVEDTATGNPLTFLTDVSKPLKSLLIPFTPKQEGTGEPSPTNVRSIVPWNGLTVWHGGKNLFNKDDPDIQLDKRIATGGTIINSQYSQAVTGFIPVKEGAKYIINNYINSNYFSCFYSEKDITKPVGAIFGNNEYPKIAPNGAKYLIVTIGNTGINGFQIEVGETASAYVPYSPVTETDVAFSSPVYGGTLDVVSGVLTVTMVGREFDGSSDENWSLQSTEATTRAIAWDAVRGAIIDGNRVIACNCLKPSQLNQDEAYTNGILNTTQTRNIRIRVSQDAISFNDFKAFLQEQPVFVVCPLVTPQTFQLTPEQITALKGDNTLWSDANGSMTAVFFKKA